MHAFKCRWYWTWWRDSTSDVLRYQIELLLMKLPCPLIVTRRCATYRDSRLRSRTLTGRCRSRIAWWTSPVRLPRNRRRLAWTHCPVVLCTVWWRWSNAAVCPRHRVPAECSRFRRRPARRQPRAGYSCSRTLTGLQHVLNWIELNWFLFST